MERLMPMIIACIALLIGGWFAGSMNERMHRGEYWVDGYVAAVTDVTAYAGGEMTEETFRCAWKVNNPYREAE